jgi:hypothetical protein
MGVPEREDGFGLSGLAGGEQALWLQSRARVVPEASNSPSRARV